MKKIIKLTESDINRIVRRVINEGLSVSDTGELIGDVGPDRELYNLFGGFSSGHLIDNKDNGNIRKTIRQLNYKIINLFEFGYLNLRKNDYILIKLDRNSDDQLFRQHKSNAIILFKNGYWYDGSVSTNLLSLKEDKNPCIEERGKKICLNDLDIFHDFAMDMVNNGIDKYYVRVRD